MSWRHGSIRCVGLTIALGGLMLALVWQGFWPQTGAWAADDETVAGVPPAPAVSKFAPAGDIEFQMEKYINEITKGVETEADYKDLPEGKIAQTGSTMVLLAAALAMSDQDSKYKPAGEDLVAACQKLAATTDYAATKKAVEAMVAASKGTPQLSRPVKWGRLAKMQDLMKQVPNVNTRLKNNLKPKNLKKRGKEATGNLATLAVIAQGSMFNVKDTIQPKASAKWFDYCADMRDAAAALNQAVHGKKGADVIEAKMDRLQQSCEDCHAIFKPKGLKPAKTEPEEK